jgi:hypothetical protein
MATPIKDTPVLIGKNARHFETWLTENADKKISTEKYAKIKAAASKFRLVTEKATFSE